LGKVGLREPNLVKIGLRSPNLGVCSSTCLSKIGKSHGGAAATIRCPPSGCGDRVPTRQRSVIDGSAGGRRVATT